MKKILHLFSALCVTTLLFSRQVSTTVGKDTLAKDSLSRDSLLRRVAPQPNIKPQTTAVVPAPVREAVKCGDDSLTQALGISAACGCGKTGPMWLAWTVIGLFIFIFLVLAWKSSLLRDDTDDAILLANAQKLEKYKNVTDASLIPRPFSLSRLQLGVWTVVIACSYVYLSLHCCASTMLAVSTQLLALMGISAGTAAAGNVIDASKSVPAADGTQPEKSQNYPSEGWYIDILSDANGISIHRFQNVVFTFVTVLIYVYMIPLTTCGHLPVLDTTLIALNGISSTTYLGLKMNENK